MSVALGFVRLLRAPYADPGRTRALRLAKLQRLVAHARARVPFYAGSLAGVEAGAVTALEDVRRLPVVRPAQLRERPTDEVTAAGLDRAGLVRDATSGSSGVPFTFYLTPAEFTLRQLRLLRCLVLHGLRPWWSWVTFHPELETPRATLFQRLVASRRHRIPVGLPVDEQARRLLRIDPQVVQGLTSTIDVLATRLLERGLRTRRTRLVLTAGEVFPPGLERKVAAAFGCRVVDQYGGNEVGPIGYSCPHCDLHYVDDDAFILEVLDADDRPVGPGGRGRAVLTVLDQLTTPILRLDMGDLVTLPREGPRCKNRFTHYASVDGREADRIALAGGRVLHVQHVIAATLGVEGLRRLQVVQRADGGIVCRYSARPGFERGRIESAVGASLGLDAATPHSFEPCEQIPLEPSGKFRMVKRER